MIPSKSDLLRKINRASKAIWRRSIPEERLNTLNKAFCKIDERIMKRYDPVHPRVCKCYRLDECVNLVYKPNKLTCINPNSYHTRPCPKGENCSNRTLCNLMHPEDLFMY